MKVVQNACSELVTNLQASLLLDKRKRAMLLRSEEGITGYNNNL